MQKAGSEKVVIVLLHAFAVWALCGASMGIGMAVTSEENAIIIHAIAAPVIALAISSVYFRKFNYTTPLQTAIIFVSFVVLVDFFIVALLILKSFEMFGSFLGIWIPLFLIFITTYANGVYVNKRVRKLVL
jgi:hypothetical protein